MKSKNDTPHICIFYWDLGLGGVQRKIDDVASYISRKHKKRVKISVLLNYKNVKVRKRALFVKSVLRQDCQVDYCPGWKWRRFKFPYTLYALWFVWRLKPNVILSFLHRHGVIAVLAKHIFFWRQIRVVQGQDIVLSKSLTEMFAESKKEEYWWKFLVRLFYPAADVIIVPTSQIKRDLLGRFSVPDAKISVVHNWVELPKQRIKIKKYYDLIYVGRISPQKMPKILVETVYELKKARLNPKLCILGQGELFEEVVLYSKTRSVSSNIDFFGIRKDVSNFLVQSKIFILTSSYEGEPISVLEALAHGLPVVTLKYPGVRNLIINGETGFVCNNKKQLVEKTKFLLANQKIRAKMGENAKLFVKKYHSIANLETFIAFLEG